MNFFEALSKANQIIEAINMLAAMLKANTESNQQVHQSNLQLLDATNKQIAQSEQSEKVA